MKDDPAHRAESSHDAASPVASGGRWYRVYSRRSEVPERGDEEKKRQYGGYKTINAESLDEGALNVHEVYRERYAYRGVENRAQTQSARKWGMGEQCRDSEHAQIIDNAEISERHAENARIGAAGYDVAAIDGRRTPQQLIGIDRIGIIRRVDDADERHRKHEIGRR